uniref:Carn_acyltransf domain-containing protein n=1 Tax=Macrostomum lignano TaxID=282301 RepID=A0A1I8FGM2_9PLAT
YSGYRDGGLAVQRSRESDKPGKPETRRLPGSGGVIRDSRRSPERQPVHAVPALPLSGMARLCGANTVQLPAWERGLILMDGCLSEAGRLLLQHKEVDPAYQCFFARRFPARPAASLLVLLPWPCDCTATSSRRAAIDCSPGVARRPALTLILCRPRCWTWRSCFDARDLFCEAAVPVRWQTMPNRKCHYRQFALTGTGGGAGHRARKQVIFVWRFLAKRAPLLIVRSFLQRIRARPSAKNKRSNKSKSKSKSRSSSASSARSSSSQQQQQFVPAGLAALSPFVYGGPSPSNNRRRRRASSTSRHPPHPQRGPRHLEEIFGMYGALRRIDIPLTGSTRS